MTAIRAFNGLTLQILKEALRNQEISERNAARFKTYTVKQVCDERPADPRSTRQKIAGLILQAKQHYARRAIHAERIARDLAAYGVAATKGGVPVDPFNETNGLKDLWGQLYFLDEGRRLGQTYGDFKDRWFITLCELCNQNLANCVCNAE
jgi:hypothetical protein